MIDETQTPERNRQDANRSNVWYIVALVVLLCTGVYLLVANVNKSHENVALTTQIDQSNTRYADLDKQYSATLAEVASYKGQNATLDSIINVKEGQINSMRGQLAKAKKDRMISESDYKKQMAELNGIVSDLTAQVASLQNDKKVLLTQNDSLGKRVAEETVVTNNLTQTNSVLSKKVAIASLLTPQNLNVTGIKERRNGKEKTTERASKASAIRVCFDVGENKVADPGTKNFYARIIGPDGVTLAVQDLGSGVMKTAEDTSNAKAFTTKETINYDQKPQNVCMFWKQPTGYTPGSYSVELYQDGYFIGKSNFLLK